MTILLSDGVIMKYFGRNEKIVPTYNFVTCMKSLNIENRIWILRCVLHARVILLCSYFYMGDFPRYGQLF